MWVSLHRLLLIVLMGVWILLLHRVRGLVGRDLLLIGMLLLLLLLGIAVISMRRLKALCILRITQVRTGRISSIPSRTFDLLGSRTVSSSPVRICVVDVARLTLVIRINLLAFEVFPSSSWLRRREFVIGVSHLMVGAFNLGQFVVKIANFWWFQRPAFARD